MAQQLIEVEKLSKRFCRDLKRSLWFGVKDLAAEYTGLRSSASELRRDEFWALRDISFSVERGECLGLVGRNGAGKTTLLRLLNGLIKPDQGRVTMRGSVSALIALGAGFNPVLTGRENVYVNGAVLGFTRRELKQYMPSIVEFAELDAFMDAPVRTYSSGMKVRLGFAVAIHLRPDILLVDEVLAVGDLAFRNKCLEKINLLREGGTAFLFVSHNIGQISRVCNRVLYLVKGENAALGETETVLSKYVGDQSYDDGGSMIHLPGADAFMTLKSLQLLDGEGVETSSVVCGDPLLMRFKVQVVRELKQAKFVFFLEPFQRQGIIASFGQDLELDPADLGPGEHLLELQLPSVPLTAGAYRIRLSVMGGEPPQLCSKIMNAAQIRVMARPGQLVSGDGYVYLSSAWKS